MTTTGPLHRAVQVLRSSSRFLWGLLMLAIWEAAVLIFQIPGYVLPAPHLVVVDFFDRFSYIMQETAYTLSAAFAGFVLGIAVSFVLATLFNLSPLLERSLFPYFVASQAVPIIAFSVIIISVFGNGWPAEVFIAVFLVFVPVTVSWMKGLNASDPAAVSMMRSFGASPWQIFWQLRFYNALPFVFSGAKVCAIVALAGAIVGEFVGAPHGIGIILLRAIYYQNTVRLWVVIALCALIGSGSYYLVSLIERRVLWWKLSTPVQPTGQ